MRSLSMLQNETATPRIGALSILPLFFRLTDKRAVVAGATAAATWKAELLCAAGAKVEVFAEPEDVSTEMAALAESTPSLKLTPRRWQPADLKDAAIAIADAEEEEEAAAFAAAAAAVGAPCNVIDKPDYCQFQFGTIVNRSPVVVGVSTSGASPVLGQAIRRKIETLLPAQIAEWADLAHSWRKSLAEKVPFASGQRTFWEQFVNRAFISRPGKDALEELHAAASAVENKGHVTFVGAGPGDAELLTLKAVRALQAAEVILFDDLVSDEVLELARREAKRILVGKRAGRPSCKQHEINEMMVKLAKAGRRVVRLKSGDPMIFGRAGEEIEALEEAGIGYDVVPGVTAGLAMASRLGVSLTHRDCAKSVRFVTGHSRHGGLPKDVDWKAIADRSATTVFYMGGRTAGAISATLIEHGMSADTPVAVGADIGRSTEIIRRTNLAGLEACCNEIGQGQPVLIAVGEVFRQRAVVGQFNLERQQARATA